MSTLFGYAHFFNFVSFLLYPTEVKRLKCPMLGAFTVNVFVNEPMIYLLSVVADSGSYLKHCN